jgi:diadenosine tetraphosphate (Ap4A) HIT family hydrolase
MNGGPCPLCAGSQIDARMGRVQVWEDALWRLTTSTGPGDPTPGFSYLEPKRHIPSIADLDGAEAETFGSAVAKCAQALKKATGADAVYVYVFGADIDHLHVHLAPHRDGDALNDAVLKGDFIEEPMPAGGIALVSTEYPPLPQETLRGVADRIRQLLN